MKSALDVHQALLARGVRHEIVRLAAPVAAADDLPGALGVDRDRCLVVRCYSVEGARTADGAVVHLAAALVRAGDSPDDEEVRAALGAAAVRPAAPGEVSAHTDYAAALVSPVGLPRDLAVLADSALTSPTDDPHRTVYCATGETGTALALRLRDLLVHSGARVAPLGRTPAASRTDQSAGGARVLSLPDAFSERRRDSAPHPLVGRRRGGTRSAV